MKAGCIVRDRGREDPDLVKTVFCLYRIGGLSPLHRVERGRMRCFPRTARIPIFLQKKETKKMPETKNREGN